MNLRPLPPPQPGDMQIIEPLCSVFRRKLKSEGLKYTPERAQILDEIMRRDDPGYQAGPPREKVRDAAQAGAGARGGAGGVGGAGTGGSGGLGAAATGKSSGGVFEADELLEAVRRKGLRVSKATIYRTIKLLAEAGIIQQVLVDSEQAHYQLAYGKRSTGLLINVDTREITSIDLPELAVIRDRICRERGLVPEGHRLVIYGRSPTA